jgi:hypothetical protein
MITGQFTGTWKLVSNEYRQSDGQLIYPYGRDAVGIAMFDDDGHYSAQIMRPDCPAFASGDIRKGTPVEVKAAYEGFFSYYGVYKVNQEECTVILHVGGSSFPNWVGTAQKRYFKSSNNRVTMSTQPILLGGQEVTGVLTWERAE